MKPTEKYIQERKARREQEERLPSLKQEMLMYKLGIRLCVDKP